MPSNFGFFSQRKFDVQFTNLNKYHTFFLVYIPINNNNDTLDEILKYVY